MARSDNPAFALVWRHYLLARIRADWKVAVPGLILPGIGQVLIAYVPPLVITAIVMRFADERPTFEMALPYVLAFIGTWALGEVIWRIAMHWGILAEVKGMKQLYIFAMDELLKKDLAFFHNNFAGSLTKKAIGYGRSYEQFFDTVGYGIMRNLIPLLFAVVILWFYSPLLVVTLVGLLTLTFCLIFPLIKRRMKLVKVREDASNKFAGHIADVIGNIDAVQAYAHEANEAKLHHDYTTDYLQKTKRSWDYQNLRIDMVASPMGVLNNTAGLVLALLFIGVTDITVVFVIFSFFMSATMIIWEFNQIYRNLESALSDGAQFTELLLTAPTIVDAPGATRLSVTRGDIYFQDVTFTYPGKSKKPLFSDLQLIVHGGEKIALVGHSGGGKTTITKLLLRFMGIDKGAISIDGQDIAHTTLSSLRSHIAYVPQESIMFHRSLRDNIRYGRPEASDEEVVAAARKAHAHEFITELPEQYDTLVGERGIKLSGGQRQRIAIARAILKDAPILVLDEATSALDSESEKYIQDALGELMKNRTSIVIAHRLSTIQKMDRIIVLEKGRIAEDGSHSELLAQDGIYASLWAHQSGGFIEE